MDVVMSVADTAKLLGVSRRNVDRMCRDGRITHVCRVGSRLRINVSREFPELEIGGCIGEDSDRH